MIFSKKKDLWEFLVSKSKECDKFVSKKNHENYYLNVNKEFVERAKRLEPFIKFRKRRSKIAKLTNSKIIYSNQEEVSYLSKKQKYLLRKQKVNDIVNS